MKVLVTGSAGFIGMHLCLALREQGHSVVGVDCFTPYYSVQLKEERAKELEQNGVLLIRKDVAEPGFLTDLLAEHHPTHIVHLAAQPGVRYSLENPFAYLHSNIDGFVSLLEAVRCFPHIRVVFASSSSVYGTNQKVPFCETDSTDHPANLYGATKKANEVMAYSYHHLFGLSLVGLRFFTVYGPWGRPDMAYFRFAEQIEQNEEIRLFGQGMRRDFTYVDDVVEGIIRALSYEEKWALFNIGGSRPEPVEKLIHLLEQNLKKAARVRLIEPQPGDMQETYADTSLIERELGFVPKISLEEGISLFCEWLQKHKK